MQLNETVDEIWNNIHRERVRCLRGTKQVPTSRGTDARGIGALAQRTYEVGNADYRAVFS